MHHLMISLMIDECKCVQVCEKEGGNKILQRIEPESSPCYQALGDDAAKISSINVPDLNQFHTLLF